MRQVLVAQIRLVMLQKLVVQIMNIVLWYNLRNRQIQDVNCGLKSNITLGKILLRVLPFFHIDIEYNSEKEKEFYVNKFNELTSLGGYCGSLKSINQFDIMILDDLPNKEVE